MLVSSCSDPRSAATSEHNAAESDADGAAVLDDGLPTDDGLPDALPLELQAAVSSTRTDGRTARQARRLSVTLLILRERAASQDLNVVGMGIDDQDAADLSVVEHDPDGTGCRRAGSKRLTRPGRDRR